LNQLLRSCRTVLSAVMRFFESTSLRFRSSDFRRSSPLTGSDSVALALLFTIGHQVVLSLARWAALIHARFHETGATREFRWSPYAFVYRAVTFFVQAFQPVPLASRLLTPCHLRNGGRSSHYPVRATLTGLTHARFGLVPFRSPLLGESMSLSFPAATEMGQFSAFPAAGYGFTSRSRGAPSCRFRISDTPGGYDVEKLLHQIERILGLHQEWPVALIGIGHLGEAIARYEGFRRQGIRIAALFDSEPSKIGSEVNGMAILADEQLERVMREQGIRLAILAVPASRAQEVSDLLVAAGVRAILNYAPVVIQVPEGVWVRHIDPVAVLHSMTYYLAREEDKGT
jgi:NADH/NAD ratio-sensing transcriptional regulator Rex